MIRTAGKLAINVALLEAIAEDRFSPAHISTKSRRSVTRADRFQSIGVRNAACSATAPATMNRASNAGATDPNATPSQAPAPSEALIHTRLTESPIEAAAMACPDSCIATAAGGFTGSAWAEGRMG